MWSVTKLWMRMITNSFHNVNALAVSHVINRFHRHISCTNYTGNWVRWHTVSYLVSLLKCYISSSYLICFSSLKGNRATWSIHHWLRPLRKVQHWLLSGDLEHVWVFFVCFWGGRTPHIYFIHSWGESWLNATAHGKLLCACHAKKTGAQQIPNSTVNQWCCEAGCECDKSGLMNGAGGSIRAGYIWPDGSIKQYKLKNNPALFF